MAVLLGTALGGCTQLGYYAQSAGGHLDLMARGEPISELLAPGADTPATLRERLALAADIRAFATARLGLPDNGSYSSYSALDRPFVVWSVVAAPPLSLEPRSWCFPFAGCVSYRGYFSRDAARTYAAGLAASGDDVFVGGVPAYSTLGWFDDPLPSTVIHWAPRRLAGLIFHELAHQVAYVDDDSGFNEAFATTVQRAGVRRWLRATGREAELAEAAAEERDRKRLLDLLAGYRDRLATVYASDLPRGDQLRQKMTLFADLEGALDGLSSRHGPGPWDAWTAGPLNNARLALVTTYHGLVPGFEALLAEAPGDFPAFYHRVRTLAELPREARRERLAVAAHRAGGSIMPPSSSRGG